MGSGGSEEEGGDVEIEDAGDEQVLGRGGAANRPGSAGANELSMEALGLELFTPVMRKGFDQDVWRVVLISQEAFMLLEHIDLLDDLRGLRSRGRTAQCPRDDSSMVNVAVLQQQLGSKVSSEVFGKIARELRPYRNPNAKRTALSREFL
jgi:hypothetical protein